MRRCGGSTNAVTWVIASTAIPDEMISIKACVAAMVWRAAHQGLNATSSRENRSPSPCVSTTRSGFRLNTPVRYPPSSKPRSELKPARAASAAARPASAPCPPTSHRAVAAPLSSPTSAEAGGGARGRHGGSQVMDRDGRRAVARGGAPTEERGGVGRAQARDPGADDVGDVKRKNFAEMLRRHAGTGNEGAKVFEGSHGRGDFATQLGLFSGPHKCFNYT